MRPVAHVFDAVSMGTALAAEPEAYVVMVMKNGVRLAQFFVSNPDYVAPPPPTPAEEAYEALREAREARREAAEAENEAFWAWQKALKGEA